VESVTKLPLQYVHEYRDRHGKLRRYFRRQGKKTPLPGLPGSVEFMTAYQTALSGADRSADVGASRTKPGSVNAVVIGYYQSLAFRSLASSSQRKRRLLLERFRNANGDTNISSGTQQNIVRLLNQMKPFAARNMLKALRALLEFAVSEGFRSDNPTLGLKLPRIKSDGIHTWTDGEIEKYERYYPSGTKERLAIALLLGTAQRCSDIVRMGRQHVHAGMITVRQDKTRTTLDIQIGSELAQELEGAGSSLIFMLTARGKPFTPGGFGDWFKKRCVEAGLSHCSAHGLRKAACRRMAEAGCTAHEIMAVSGHKSLAEVERYCKAASQRVLAKLASAKREHASG
jgi:integrase